MLYPLSTNLFVAVGGNVGIGTTSPTAKLHVAGTARMNGTQVPAFVLLAWIVLVATVLAYVTGVLSVRRLSPPVAGVVACLEAVIATVLAWVLLGEHLSAPQILGGAVVLAGAFIAQSSAPAKGPAEPVASGGTEKELPAHETAA